MCLLIWYNRHMVKRKLPPDDVIVAQYTEGQSTEQIAALHGVYPTAVKNILRRLGVPRRTLSEAAKLRAARGIVPHPPKGPHNHRWTDGADHRDEYRRMLAKLECETCGAVRCLVIHHVDFNHFNNVPENLQVLCAWCHGRLHRALQLRNKTR